MHLLYIIQVSILNMINGMVIILLYSIYKDLNSLGVIYKLFDSMFVSKISIFYCHNLVGFDIFFILRPFMERIHNNGKPFYKLYILPRDNRIIKLVVKLLDTNGKVVKYITIYDSYVILPEDLKTLCKKYEVSYTKGIFPSNFANENTLFYIGNTPNISYFGDKITMKEY